MSAKVAELETQEPDFEPIMQIVGELQNQIANMQPVAIKQVRDANGRLIGGVRVLPDGTEQEITIQ